MKHEAYSSGDIGTAAQKAFLRLPIFFVISIAVTLTLLHIMSIYENKFASLCRMDEMMCGQRGWRELSVLGDKKDQLSGRMEGLICSPKSGEAKSQHDDWPVEEVL